MKTIKVPYSPQAVDEKIEEFIGFIDELETGICSCDCVATQEETDSGICGHCGGDLE